MNQRVKEIIAGILMSAILMVIIAYVVAKWKYSYIFNDWMGFERIYIYLLGYGFFGNLALYGLFWYLNKEYIQRGILIVTVIASLIFLINRFTI